MPKKYNGGFTLIELLVVISIIGLLATFAFIALKNAREKGRDARRKADLTQIRKALDLYFDKYGYYPPSSCGYDCNGYYYSTSGGNWIPGLEEFLPRMPLDPRNTAAGPWTTGNYSYAYGNVGRNTYPPQYDLTTQLENTNDPDRCAVQCYRWYFDNRNWCCSGGGYSGQIFETSHLKGF
ncbi:MAG: prepilin-type N-terminal cleavage/methylation domain-containing protein [Patescibacteria group bacterium]